MLRGTESCPILASLMKINKEGSVRIDLLGGTLDLWPINFILPDVVTLNMAINRRVCVSVEKNSSSDGIIIESLDYHQTYHLRPGETCSDMDFIIQLLSGVGVTSGVKLSLQSGSSPGAGLGGSSAMGITLMTALNEWLSLNWSCKEMIRYTCGVEAKILNKGPAGYQDYYPTCYGGVLALRPAMGEIVVEQLFNSELVDYLENRLTLVYSGQSRQSGINNWEVYKKFFDGDHLVRLGLGEIAELSFRAYLAIKDGNFSELLSLMVREGEVRADLFSDFTPSFIKQFIKSLGLPYKMCGAGGGGCFILIHKPGDRQNLLASIREAGMTFLDYKISGVLGDEKS